jgi:N-acyl-D-aspartate/D-glutamate deacylase
LFNADFFNNRRSIVNRFKNCGRIRLMVLSGIFSHRPNAPADLVIAGDDLKKTLIDQTIKNIEAETGRDLTYAVFDSSDFMYRFHSSDRFVRDLFESSHERLIDKLALED